MIKLIISFLLLPVSLFCIEKVPIKLAPLGTTKYEAIAGERVPIDDLVNDSLKRVDVTKYLNNEAVENRSQAVGNIYAQIKEKKGRRYYKLLGVPFPKK